MAILGLLFGAIGLCCSPMALVGMFSPQEQTMEFMGKVVESPPQATGVPFVILLLSHLLALGLSFLLIAASIGSLMLRPWGRVSMIWYGILDLLNTAIYFLAMLPMISWQMEFMRGMMDQQVPDGALLVGGVIGMLCSVLCFSIYPIAALIIFTRPAVKAAFESGGMPPGGWQQYPPQGGYYPPEQQQGYYPPQDAQQGGYYPPQQQYPPQQPQAPYPPQQYPPQQQGEYYPPEEYEPPPEDEGPPGEERR